MNVETAELYSLLDMHGQLVNNIDRQEVSRLKTLGVVNPYGNKKRTIGYKLTCPLTLVAGYDYCERSMVPANYGGTRYVYREEVKSETCNSFVYRLKSLLAIESPAHSLLRILTPVALEAPTYQPLSTCTEEQRVDNPAHETRKRNREIFRLGRVALRRKAAAEEVTPKYKPVSAPLLPVVAMPVAA